MLTLLVPVFHPLMEPLHSWLIQQEEGKWNLLLYQYMEWKKKKKKRKKASRRNIMIGHLLNKCKFKHISSLKIKLKHSFDVLASSEPVLV